jgi:hypothetical protein
MVVGPCSTSGMCALCPWRVSGHVRRWVCGACGSWAMFDIGRMPCAHGAWLALGVFDIGCAERIAVVGRVGRAVVGLCSTSGACPVPAACGGHWAVFDVRHVGHVAVVGPCSTSGVWGTRLSRAYGACGGHWAVFDVGHVAHLALLGRAGHWACGAHGGCWAVLNVGHWAGAGRVQTWVGGCSVPTVCAGKACQARGGSKFR